MPVHTCVWECVSVSVCVWRQILQENLQQFSSSGDAKVIAIEKLPREKNETFPAYTKIFFPHPRPPRIEEIFLNYIAAYIPLRK